MNRDRFVDADGNSYSLQQAIDLAAGSPEGARAVRRLNRDNWLVRGGLVLASAGAAGVTWGLMYESEDSGSSSYDSTTTAGAGFYSESTSYTSEESTSVHLSEMPFWRYMMIGGAGLTVTGVLDRGVARKRIAKYAAPTE